MAASDDSLGIWKKRFTGKSRHSPKGRQIDDDARAQIAALLQDRPRRRDLLIEFIHLVQDTYGCVSENHIAALAHELKLSQAEVYEVATFYSHFDVVKSGEPPPPPLTVRVCDSLSCEIAGAQALIRALRQNVIPTEVRVIRAPCMGRCDTAPVAEVGHYHIDHADHSRVLAAILAKQIHPVIHRYQTYADYIKEGGYQALKSLRVDGNWQEVQETILSSGLRGLGGAGFPTGKKWGFVRSYTGPRYLAVNADEGEPGTFKDRYFLEQTPHLFLEGMLIAAWAVDAEKVFIYLRDEYPVARKILLDEIAMLESVGLINKDFIDLRRGAGAYICGEESAMIESIEGKRGLPRHRPPFVAQVGIFNQPTLVHNVETLVWVARVMREGAEILNAIRHNGRAGLRNYSVSGRVKKPGLYLLPAGSTVLEVIEAADGMLEGHTFKAYQPGGPSSGLLPASICDVPLDFDTLQDHNTFIGSAAVVILSDKDSAKDAALNMLRFFEDESCGQCTPCRNGCEKAVQLMQEPHWDQPLLSDLCEVMADASICGLGQAAANPIRLTIKHFANEIQDV
ncbi:MAG: NAD(P)H-dependent oxidoreductase subunit E [Aestuariivita sp.]|nr:NAD(P)H-dependent oxidoreductase subunit E [Aestuariivita sp.]MCY4201076.1 NAD(P)H-dependent oxidoreductase subunit E [Aestuariivita sp.]MCY4287055.1 NAD(P)H-dependent oxidoreductase subunit E [Aestuariivita sp.]MCY4345212.1 NAD(P)H-dependent oxidoreductase subunit E [Aestuariivita sp.]